MVVVVVVVEVVVVVVVVAAVEVGQGSSGRDGGQTLAYSALASSWKASLIDAFLSSENFWVVLNGIRLRVE